MSKSNYESSSGTHVDMWQPMSGKKSTIKDKVHRVILRANKDWTYGMRGQVLLTPSLPNWLGEEKERGGERQPREGRRKKKRVLERETLTSL